MMDDQAGMPDNFSRCMPEEVFVGEVVPDGADFKRSETFLRQVPECISAVMIDIILAVGLIFHTLV